MKSSRLVHSVLNHCAHGRELLELSVTGKGTNRWLLLGEYACKKCLRIELESYDERPEEVLIAGRRLPVRVEGAETVVGRVGLGRQASLSRGEPGGK